MERIYVDLFIAWWISLRKGDAPPASNPKMQVAHVHWMRWASLLASDRSISLNNN
jgi:hypothetical protein